MVFFAIITADDFIFNAKTITFYILIMFTTITTT
jgi:hypothetical protein